MNNFIKQIIFLIISILCTGCSVMNWKLEPATIISSEIKQTNLRSNDKYTSDLNLAYEYKVNNKIYKSKKFIYLEHYYKNELNDYCFEPLKAGSRVNIKYSQNLPFISKFEPEWLLVKAKIILSPENLSIEAVGDREFIVTKYPKVYYEYFIDEKTFRNNLEVVFIEKSLKRLEYFKNNSQYFSKIYNVKDRFKEKEKLGLKEESIKLELAQEDEKELFERELNESLEETIKLKNYKDGINIYIDQNNPQIAFWEKPKFGELANKKVNIKETSKSIKNFFQQFSSMLLVMGVVSGLPIGFIYFINWLINLQKYKNFTKLSKSREREEILNSAEEKRQIIFENTLEQIDKFLYENENTIYDFEIIRNTWFRVLIIGSFILSALIISTGIYLFLAQIYSDIPFDILFCFKVILGLILMFPLLYWVQFIPTIIKIFIYYPLCLIMILLMFSKYFFLVVPIVFVPICILEYFKLTKKIILNKNYQLKFKNEIIKKLFTNKFQNFTFEPEEYFNKAFIESSKLFTVHGYHAGDDFIMAECHGIEFMLSEIHLKTEDQEDGYFDGLFIQINILKKHTSIFGTNPNFGNKILFDYPEFNSFFNVYGNNTLEAFYLLSTDILEKLIDLQISLGNANISFSIIGQKANFAIHSKKEFFEPPNLINAWDPRVYFEYIKVLNFVNDLCYAFATKK